MKAGSHQNIHYGAPSWPYLTEPITAPNRGYAREFSGEELGWVCQLNGVT